MTRLWGPTPPSVHPALLFLSLPSLFSSLLLPFLLLIWLILFPPLCTLSLSFFISSLLFLSSFISLISLLPPSFFLPCSYLYFLPSTSSPLHFSSLPFPSLPPPSLSFLLQSSTFLYDLFFTIHLLHCCIPFFSSFPYLHCFLCLYLPSLLPSYLTSFTLIRF